MQFVSYKHFKTQMQNFTSKIFAQMFVLGGIQGGILNCGFGLFLGPNIWSDFGFGLPSLVVMNKFS